MGIEEGKGEGKGERMRKGLERVRISKRHLWVAMTTSCQLTVLLQGL